MSKFFRDGSGKQGKQSIEVDGFEIPLRHDGLKYFMNIREPIKSDWDQLPIIELTPPIPWRGINVSIRRMRKNKNISPTSLQEWSERLGHLNLKATENTLRATTQLISSVEAETRATPRRHMKTRLPALRGD